MQPVRQRFVLLRFASERGDDRRGGASSLLLTQDGDTLKIFTEQHWDSALEAEDREYLMGLLEDWRHASPDEIPAILDELSELSVGSLRAVESGVADGDKLKALLAAFGQ